MSDHCLHFSKFRLDSLLRETTGFLTTASFGLEMQSWALILESFGGLAFGVRALGPLLFLDSPLHGPSASSEPFET